MAREPHMKPFKVDRVTVDAQGVRLEGLLPLDDSYRARRIIARLTVAEARRLALDLVDAIQRVSGTT